MPQFLNLLSQIPNDAKVCLYGVGEGCLHFMQTLQTGRPDVDIICLLDDASKDITAIVPVLLPAELPSLNYDLVLVTSAYWIDISEKLEKLGCVKFMVVGLELLYKHMIFDSEEICRWKKEISEASALLYGESQTALYMLIIASRTLDPTCQQKLYDHYHAGRSSGPEYLEYINKSHLHTIIEGGVFDGHDTIEFSKLLDGEGVVHGFDPNLGIVKNIPSLHANPKIRLYPFALWREKDTLNFFSNANNRPGARIVGDMEGAKDIRNVSAVSIDKFVEENSIQKVDFIKLDVEGAELDVLQGAAVTLKGHRPQLAICIYHKKEHMFNIPLYLDSLLENYRYYIGHYSATLWDTVWYAVPDELTIDSTGRNY